MRGMGAEDASRSKEQRMLRSSERRNVGKVVGDKSFESRDRVATNGFPAGQTFDGDLVLELLFSGEDLLDEV